MPGRLVVRAPNHLGEVILALPALRRAAAREKERGARPPVVQVVSWLVPVLRMAELGAEILPLEDRRAIMGAASSLRARDCERGVLLTPAFSAALIFRLGGVVERRGTDAGGRGFLLTDRVDREPLLSGHRVDEFLALADPDYQPRDLPPEPRLGSANPGRAQWEALTTRLAITVSAAPIVGLIPSAQAPARRWPTERFAELATRFSNDGFRTFVFGGPADAGVTAAVVSGVTGEADVWDLGGKTTLEEVTGGLAGCDLVVTNDSGPMHLAASLDRAIVAIEGPADIRQTRPLADRVTLVGRFDLPCVPCVKNNCPRTGVGYELPEARRECMRLVDVDDVYEAAQRHMRRV